MSFGADLRRVLRSSMWTAVFALLGASAAGCSVFVAATATAPSDIRPLEIGTMRFAVEAVLGDPESEEDNRATYEFSRGSFFAPGEADGLIAGVGRGLFVGLVSATHLFIMEPLSGWIAYDEIKSRHGLITLVYGPDGRVIGRSYEAAQALYVAWKTQPRPDDRLDLLCHAANAGYPSAQHAQAVRHQLGLFGTPVDVAEAYLWARLAAFGGDPRAARLQEHLAAELDPGRRAEIDARYAHWTPEPCSDLEADAPPAVDQSPSPAEGAV